MCITVCPIVHTFVNFPEAHSVWTCLTYEHDPQMLTRIPFSQYVKGMLMLENQLFVIIYNSCEVMVYDSDTFIQKPSIPVTGLTDPWDLAASGNILFVIDMNCQVFCIDLIQKSVIDTPAFSSFGFISSLSTNHRGNVIASISGTNTLIECTPDGILQRTVILPFDMSSPQRVIDLATSDPGSKSGFLVCQVGENLQNHRVCLVDANGQLGKSFGGTPGYGNANFNCPYRCVIDRNGNILVADYLNNRVVLLDQQLNYVKEIIPQSANMNGCFALCIDEYNGAVTGV